VEAARVAAEEELASRKPKTLDEAVEHAVRAKLALEKTALEAHYAGRGLHSSTNPAHLKRFCAVCWVDSGFQ
jgi:hypothetical protein